MSNASSKSVPAHSAKKSSRWLPFYAVLFVVAVYLASQIIGSLALSIYPAFQHWNEAQANQWLTTSIWAQFTYVAVAEAFTVGALYLYLKHQKSSFKAIGLRRSKWSDPLYGLAMLVPYYIVYLATVAIIQRLAPGLNVDQEQQLGFSNVTAIGPLIVVFISLVVLPPFVEELLVRGFLYTSLRRTVSKIAAAIVASIVFATGHLQFGSGAPLLWIAFIDTFVLSLFLIYLRDKTNGLYASMTLHALKNFIAFFALFIAKIH